MGHEDDHSLCFAFPTVGSEQSDILKWDHTESK